MKMLCCADLCLGAVCTENLSAGLSARWRAARAEKLEVLFDKAAQNNAGYIALFGKLFGQERVPESAIDGLFQAVRSDEHIHTLLFVDAKEFGRLSYRNDVPENLHLLCTQSREGYLDDNLAAALRQGKPELLLARHDPLTVEADADGTYRIDGLGEAMTVPSFEPLGFEDAQGKRFGFCLIEWTEETPAVGRTVADQRYAYETAEVRLLPGDGQKDILRKINAAVSGFGKDCFLHIRLVGRSAFGLTIDGDTLAAQLQNRLFFAEVFDSTEMDVDADAFETDISLRSEFVRLAMKEDSMSETERSRLISRGWAALGGKVAEGV